MLTPALGGHVTDDRVDPGQSLAPHRPRISGGQRREEPPIGSARALGRTLARVASRSPLCWMEVGTPTGEQWHLADDLLAVDNYSLRSSLDAVSQRFGGRMDVAASVLAESCARPVALGAGGAFLLERRVAHVTPTTVRLHVGTDGGFDAVALDPGIGMSVLPGDAAGGIPGVQVATGLSQLREQLALHLVGYLTPVVSAIHAHASKRMSALWGTVAHTIASSLMILGRSTGEQHRAKREADLVLEAASPPMPGSPAWFSLEYGGDEHPVPCRSTCCLARRLPGQESCSTCPLLGYEERKRRLLAWLAW